VAALLAALAVVLILVSGGGGSGSGTAGTTSSETTRPTEQKPAPKPKTLTKSQLIGKADAICEVSRSAYTDVFSRALEESPDISYAATLAGISQRGVNGFRHLNAPPSVEPAFHKYVQAQERVMRYDRQALKAAENGDAAGYVAARERRDAEAGERYDLAREIGLKQCSTNRS
jgi:hypothetical protein